MRMSGPRFGGGGEGGRVGGAGPAPPAGGGEVPSEDPPPLQAAASRAMAHSAAVRGCRESRIEIATADAALPDLDVLLVRRGQLRPADIEVAIGWTDSRTGAAHAY